MNRIHAHPNLAAVALSAALWLAAPASAAPQVPAGTQRATMAADNTLKRDPCAWAGRYSTCATSRRNAPSARTRTAAENAVMWRRVQKLRAERRAIVFAGGDAPLEIDRQIFDIEREISESRRR